MKKVLSCSIEVFTSAQSEAVFVNIPRNPLDPRLGYESKCFLSLDEFVSYVRSLPSKSEAKNDK